MSFWMLFGSLISHHFRIWSFNLKIDIISCFQTCQSKLSLTTIVKRKQNLKLLIKSKWNEMKQEKERKKTTTTAATNNNYLHGLCLTVRLCRQKLESKLKWIELKLRFGNRKHYQMACFTHIQYEFETITGSKMTTTTTIRSLTQRFAFRGGNGQKMKTHRNSIQEFWHTINYTLNNLSNKIRIEYWPIHHR